MKFVVAGGAGFIGSNLVDALIEQGNEVLILDNFSTGTRENVNPKAKFTFKDIALAHPNELERACEDADGIFHMAASPNVQMSIENPLSTIPSNLITTVRLLEMARKYDIKLVYSGSCSCYGDATNKPTNEKQPINPLSPYALNKYQGEEYCELYSKIFNVKSIVLRYFNVYGNRMTNTGAYRSVLSVFLEAYCKKEPFNIVNDGEQRRDFVHVSDVVDANIKAMESDHINVRYNIGSGKNYSVNEIADMIGGEKKYGEKRIEPRETLADISRAEEQLKWKPKVKLEEWIKEIT